MSDEKKRLGKGPYRKPLVEGVIDGISDLVENPPIPPSLPIRRGDVDPYLLHIKLGDAIGPAVDQAGASLKRDFVDPVNRKISNLASGLDYGEDPVDYTPTGSGTEALTGLATGAVKFLQGAGENLIRSKMAASEALSGLSILNPTTDITSPVSVGNNQRNQGGVNTKGQDTTGSAVQSGTGAKDSGLLTTEDIKKGLAAQGKPVPGIPPSEPIENVAARDEGLSAYLDYRRSQSPGDLNRQGAFTLSGDRIVPTRRNARELEGRTGVSFAPTTSEQEFLNEFRAKQADKIARTRAAEAVTLRKYEANRQIEAARKRLASDRFFGRPEAEEDKAIIEGQLRVLAGEPEIETARLGAEAEKARVAQASAAAGATLARQVAKDIAEQQQTRREFGLDMAKEERQRRKAFGELGIKEFEAAAKEKDIASQIARRKAQTEIDRSRFQLATEQEKRAIIKDVVASLDVTKQTPTEMKRYLLQRIPGATDEWIENVIANKVGK